MQHSRRAAWAGRWIYSAAESCMREQSSKQTPLRLSASWNSTRGREAQWYHERQPSTRSQYPNDALVPEQPELIDRRSFCKRAGRWRSSLRYIIGRRTPFPAPRHRLFDRAGAFDNTQKPISRPTPLSLLYTYRVSRFVPRSTSPCAANSCVFPELVSHRPPLTTDIPRRREKQAGNIVDLDVCTKAGRATLSPELQLSCTGVSYDMRGLSIPARVFDLHISRST
jgi:hypothetical protein